MSSLSETTSDTPAEPSRASEATVHRLERSSPLSRKTDAPLEDAPAKDKVEDKAPEKAGPAAPKRSRSRMLMFALLPVALVAGGYFYVTGGAVMSTDNAYVQADMVGLSTDVSGIVSQVAVHDNQTVAKGDILFKLDQTQFQLALDRADAQIGIVRNDLTALQSSYRDMQAQIGQAQADVQFNTVNFQRQQQLLTNNFTSKANFDAAQNTLRAAQQKVASLQAQLAAIAANLNGNPDAPIEDHPRYKDALAARAEAARQLDHTTVRAPFAGIVTNVPSLQPGQYLAAATVGFNIVSSDHVWVQASPKETELTYVKPGQKATIEVDTYPGSQWTGAVDSVSPASASSFSLLPAENTSGNWVKVVQRIPMRVRVENQPGKPPLRVGMSVELNVDTGHARGFPQFISKLFGGRSSGSQSLDSQSVGQSSGNADKTNG
ncbi:HlyD family secretion protein [Roseiarcaceae bacterium H3SJ34-1]|uniref:HlyD family secretion protein n=1 Tax=Terripilifer ovatus TaxID=3032367 RepID=UPI003AB9769F|nr:HlyD family secretion protein [Roseiarcaceae bacterium H3SJ34-1]